MYMHVNRFKRVGVYIANSAKFVQASHRDTLTLSHRRFSYFRQNDYYLVPSKSQRRIVFVASVCYGVCNCVCNQVCLLEHY